MPDAVHAATWTPAGGGILTTLTEDDDQNIVCGPHQGRATFGELADGVVKPWRDRNLFGAPVCQLCADEVDRDSDLFELFADWSDT
jgi:hypothetical protein